MVTITAIIILPQISLFWLIITIAIHAKQKYFTLTMCAIIRQTSILQMTNEEEKTHYIFREIWCFNNEMWLWNTNIYTNS